MLKNKLLQSLSASKVESVADAIDFDGTNDYLSRASDLVGNADGNTFTFSCWVSTYKITGDCIIYANGTGSAGIRVFYSAPNSLSILAYNAGSTLILDVAVNLPVLPQYTIVNVMVSVDLANPANRHIYINDILASSVVWSTYTNSTFDFTTTTHSVSANTSGASKFQGRLSHVFLAYEYIDLSLESNRRIFITADRKPA